MLNIFRVLLILQVVHAIAIPSTTEVDFSQYDVETTELDLSDKNIRSIKNIEKLVNLQKLNLSYNEIEELPPGIGKLVNLERLNLIANNLTSLPHEIGKLVKLETLNLIVNNLTELPSQIGKLVKLQKLSLDINNLTALPPEIGKLVNLETLYLSDNKLTALPPEIRQLVKLQYIYLHNNKIEELPREIGQLVNLKGLNLDGNKLTELPHEIGLLTKLQELGLSENQLTALPLQIGQLVNLERLNLRKNNLKTVPKEMRNLHNLERLDLRDNNMDEFRDGIRTMGRTELRQRFGNRVKLDDTVAAKQEEMMQVWKLVLSRTLFLHELAPLFELTKRATDLSALIRLSQNTFRKHILEVIKGCVEKSGKQDKEEKIVGLLSKVASKMGDLLPTLQSKYKSKLENVIFSLAKKMPQDTEVLDVLRRKLDVGSPGFNDYLESTVYRIVDGLAIMDEDNCAEAIQSVALKHMLEYLIILDSVQDISWESESRSFDGTDIMLTRPGFGAIVVIEPSRAIRKIIDAYRDKLLMRTRDVFFHMTLFQVFITFAKDYNCKSLPVNLLQVFNAYIDRILEEEVKRIEDVKISEMHVRLTDDMLILGRDYPSHLVVKAECKDVSTALVGLKDRINQMGQKWMVAMGEELESHGFVGTISRNPVGAVLDSCGWKLIIGYTANADYKTHVTLGLLCTGHKNVDRVLIRMHGDVERDVDAVFSPLNGRAGMDRMNVRSALKIERMKINYLGKLDISELSGDEYSSIRSKVKEIRNNLKSLRSVNKKRMDEVKKNGPHVLELQPLLVLSKKEMDEWCSFEMSRIGNKMESIGLQEQDRYVRVSRIHRSVINMNRIQNFEPINA